MTELQDEAGTVVGSSGDRAQDPAGSTLELVAAGKLASDPVRTLWGAWASVNGHPVLATGRYEGTVRLWDSTTGDARLLTGHEGIVVWGAWAETEGRRVLALADTTRRCGCGTP